MLSSGITYSNTSLRGKPRAVPCLAVDGMASSKIAPLSVVSYSENVILTEYLQFKHHLQQIYRKPQVMLNALHKRSARTTEN